METTLVESRHGEDRKKPGDGETVNEAETDPAIVRLSSMENLLLVTSDIKLLY